MKGKSKSTQRADDCPLTYPDLKTIDHAKHCPLYTEVLHRDPVTGTLAYEELDALQNDLHILLGAVTDRIKTLQAETDILIVWQDSKKADKRSPDLTASPAPCADILPLTTTLKRDREPESEKINKRLKDHAAFLRDTPAPAAGPSPSSALAAMAPRPGPGRPRLSKAVKAEGEGLDRGGGSNGSSSSAGSGGAPVCEPFADVPRLPKSDAPEKFWAMVEPYCAEITTEDLKALEEILRSHEDDAEYYKVPALGKHYAQKWAMEDMMEEKKEGSKIHVDKRPSIGDTKSQSLDISANGMAEEDDDATQKLLHAATDFDIDNDSPFGPLTQRLISALIEENVMTPVDDASLEDITGGKDASESIASMDPRTLAKQLNLRGQGDLEYQIRRELEAEGILDSDEASESGSEGDEILAELKKKQELLRALSQQNQQMTRRLQKLAREEMMRQDLRKKLAAVDADVMDAYRRIQASRQKRRSPTKKEKDVMLKALKERDAIVKQLETGSGVPGTSAGSLLTPKEGIRMH